jgi:hypothetical protein
VRPVASHDPASLLRHLPPPSPKPSTAQSRPLTPTAAAVLYRPLTQRYATTLRSSPPPTSTTGGRWRLTVVPPRYTIGSRHDILLHERTNTCLLLSKWVWLRNSTGPSHERELEFSKWEPRTAGGMGGKRSGRQPKAPWGKKIRGTPHAAAVEDSTSLLLVRTVRSN